jgi:hypothetical protein
MKWIRGSVLLLSVAGCAENSTIYHSRSIDSARPHALTVDSYQRSTYFSQPTGEDLRVCAEAAPDTFSALSASIAAEGDVKTQQARLAGAISQSGATIERTQTINLLRESLYRTCERYLSGAINKATLVVQAARDQRTMVAVLAIEQLTRAVRPPATIISAGSTRAMLPNAKIVELISAARKDRDDAKAAVAAAQKQFDAADAKGKCSTVATAPVDEAGVVNADWATCDVARTGLASRTAELGVADARLGQSLGLVNPAGDDVIAAATGSGANIAGGSNEASGDSIAAVADAVVRIVNSPAIDEALMFCVGYLGDHGFDAVADATGSSTAGMCTTLLRDRGNKDLLLVDKMIAGGVPVGSYRLGQAGDTAGPIIDSYLESPRSAAERKRRIALTARAAGTQGQNANPVDVMSDLVANSPEQNRALLNALRELETDPTARAELIEN